MDNGDEASRRRPHLAWPSPPAPGLRSRLLCPGRHRRPRRSRLVVDAAARAWLTPPPPLAPGRRCRRPRLADAAAAARAWPSPVAAAARAWPSTPPPAPGRRRRRLHPGRAIARAWLSTPPPPVV
ncbi:hypothetical protein DAI22_04g005850 [Oryza sativa Japonica Group]|nr:hypothetical protein DAI22_04g005850 [Oryza sativa Japonica Group]